MEELSVINTRETGVAGAMIDSNVINLGQHREVTSKKEITSLDNKNDKGKSDLTTEAQKNKIEHISEALDNYVNALNTNLRIQVHDETGKIIVKVISEEDGKVIREIPPEEMLNLAAKMDETMGIFFNDEV